MKNRLVQLLLKNLLIAMLICFSCLVFAQTSRKTQKTKSNTIQQKSNNSSKSNLSKAEKYALDGQKDKADLLNKKKKSAAGTSGSKNSNGTSGTKSSNGNSSQSAKKADRCQTDQYYQQRLQDPRYLEHLKFIQDKVDESLSRGYIPCDAANTVVVPIAVHFDASYDCSNVQCLMDATEAQINSLNDDFASLNADLQLYNDIITNCGGTNVASDGVCVSFCLANQNHPAGSGLTDGQPAITIGQYNGGFGAGGTGAPEWQGYLNMFVIDGLGFGVADGIGGALNGDGVTQDGSFFGGPGFTPCSSGGLLNDDAAWNLGRTMTHEVGHYLGLWHVFQDGCGDEPNTPYDVNDTPAQVNPSGGVVASSNCASLATGCTAGEFVQKNYMDYFDDLSLVMFSNEQAIAMNTFSNVMTWANDAVDLGCSDYTETSIASCVVNAAFSPPDGSDLILCADDGSPLFITDGSSLAVSWNWTFTVTSGDLVLSTASSTMQNPSPMITGGTSGTVEVTQEACDNDGICDSVTHTYTITIASGDACPNECDYTLELTDTFGDGWNGATLDIQGNGFSILGSPFGTNFTAGSSEIITITLTDSELITFNQTNGGFPGEEGFILTDPFGNVIFDTSAGNVGSGEVFSFTAYCDPPVCDDGIQNGSEGGVDCGGTSACPDCCSNGVQDDEETGVDCGGATCAPCPACPDGFDEIVNETFDSCTIPAGWSVTSTEGGEADITFTGGPLDVPGGLDPSPDFSGCIAIISDDANDAIGIGCVVTDIINIGAFINTTLTFDWQNNDFAGTGDFVVEVYDGANWVQVFIEEEDNFGTNTTVDLSSFTNADFQIRFCYNDEGGFAWGAGFDNVSVCGVPNNMCPTTVSANDVSGDYCDGSTLNLVADNNPNLVYAWSSSSASVVIADPTAASTTASISTTQMCLAETVDISAVITCPMDNVTLFDGVVSTVNVFPNPPANADDLANYVDCATASPISGCQDVITLTQEPDGMTYTVTFAHANGPDCCPDVSGSTTDIILDGDFESGGPGNGWTEFSDLPYPVIDPTFPLNGTFGIWLGGLAQGTTYVQQNITIPSTSVSAELFFNIAAGQCDCAGGDDMQVLIDGAVVWSLCNPLAGQVDDQTTICGTTDPSTGIFVAVGPVDVSAYADGSSYVLEINSFEAADDGTNTSIFVDDVQLLAEEPPGEDLCSTTITCNQNIPTLSQWGLIVLALLLMTFGSLRLGFRTVAFEKKK